MSLNRTVVSFSESTREAGIEVISFLSNFLSTNVKNDTCKELYLMFFCQIS